MRTQQAENTTNDSPIHTKITLGISNAPTSKKFSPNEAGDVVKTPAPQSSVNQGFSTLTIESMQDLSDIHADLQQDSYLLYGVSKEEQLGVRARKKDSYPFSTTSSILCGDFDSQDGTEGKTPEKLVQAWKQIIPNLDDFAYMVVASTSSNIYKGSERAYHKGNCKLYLTVESGKLIPTLLQHIADHSWLHDEGYIKLNRTGGMSAEGLVDMAMKTSNQVDYAAGAICEGGFEQRRPSPIINEGRAFTKADMPADVSAQIEPLIAAAKEAKKPESEKLREAYMIRNENQGIPRATTTRALDRDELTHDFVLKDDTGDSFTVADVYAHKTKYHGRSLYDVFGGPRSDRTKIYTDGVNPVIHTMDDGGINYALVDTPNRDKILNNTPKEQRDELSAYIDMTETEAKFRAKETAKRLGLTTNNLLEIRTQALEPDNPTGSPLNSMESRYVLLSHGSKVVDTKGLEQGLLSEYDLTDFHNAHKHLTTTNGKQLTYKWLRSPNIKRLRGFIFAPDRRNEQTIWKGEYEMLNSYQHPKYATSTGRKK